MKRSVDGEIFGGDIWEFWHSREPPKCSALLGAAPLQIGDGGMRRQRQTKTTKATTKTKTKTTTKTQTTAKRTKAKTKTIFSHRPNLRWG